MCRCYFPFEDTERAEPGRVGERGSLADPALRLHRGEVADAGPSFPLRFSLRNQSGDAVGAEELGLRGVRRRVRDRFQLIERDLGGDVLAARIVERVAAAVVTFVRAQPILP